MTGLSGGKCRYLEENHVGDISTGDGAGIHMNVLT